MTMVVPLIAAGWWPCTAPAARVDVYDALVQGAGEGLGCLARIVPPPGGPDDGGVYAAGVRGAGAGRSGPGSAAGPGRASRRSCSPLMLVRPVSGSAALGVGAELITSYGPDSYVGRAAAVMLGSTETTFYTIAVYFGAVGISRTRYAVPAALCADLTGFLAAAWAVRLCFGGG